MTKLWKKLGIFTAGAAACFALTLGAAAEPLPVEAQQETAPSLETESIEPHTYGDYLDYPEFTLVNMTLDSDVTYTGNYSLQSPTINLNGHTLTINGNFLQKSGTINVGSGTLIVTGDYTMAKPKVSGGYDSCGARLNMNAEGGKVTIGGNFTTHNLYYDNQVNLSFGELSIAGNIWSDWGITSSFKNNARLILNGSGDQSVHLKPSAGTFNLIDIPNPDERTITWGGSFYINKLTDDITITSDKENTLNLRGIDLNGHKLTINGDARKTTYGEIILGDNSSLTINGNIVQSVGTVTVGKGSLTVTGDYTMENVNESGGYDRCIAKLNMNAEGGKLTIGGNFTTHNLEYNDQVTLSFGELSIAGNIWSDRGITSSFKNNARLILNGTGDQSVYFKSEGSINLLDIPNSDKRTITWGGIFYINKLTGDTTISPDKDNTLYINRVNIDGHKLIINGDIQISYRDVNLGDKGELTINGNVVHSDGTVTVGTGSITVTGNYSMENVAESGAYNSCGARLNMNAEGGKLTIGGNFTTHQLTFNDQVNLSFGELSIAGNIWSDWGITSSFKNNARLILNGSGDQSVYLWNNNYSGINLLDIPNSDKRTITWGGLFYINTLTGDTTISPDKENILYLNRVNIDGHKLIINGDTQINNSDISLGDKGELTINGNVVHSNGTVTVGTGSITVTGNYSMENVAASGAYDSCGARLNMNAEGGMVTIGGNFTTHNLWYGSAVNLSFGILSVAGDIWSDKGITSSNNGSHQTILTGKEEQSITLADNNKFDVLVLTQPLSNYTFTPEKCWNTLITADDPSAFLTMNGKSYSSIADMIKAIPKTGADSYNIKIDGDHTEKKAIKLPKMDKPVTITVSEGKTLTLTSPTITANCPLVLNGSVQAEKAGKYVTVKANRDLTATGCTLGNTTVKGKANLSNVTVNGNLKLSAKADKSYATTDKLKNVTVTKKVTSNNSIEFIDCPSIGAVSAKGNVSVSGTATKAVSVTAKASSGITSLANVTLTKKISVKSILDVNGSVTALGTVTAAGIGSTKGAVLATTGLSISKSGLTAGTKAITLKITDKKGAVKSFKAGAAVVKKFKGSFDPALLTLDGQTLTQKGTKLCLA